MNELKISHKFSLALSFGGGKTGLKPWVIDVSSENSFLPSQSILLSLMPNLMLIIYFYLLITWEVLNKCLLNTGCFLCLFHAHISSRRDICVYVYMVGE